MPIVTARDSTARQVRAIQAAAAFYETHGGPSPTRTAKPS
jgi:hypothetical protein